MALRQSVDPRQSAAVKTLLISGCVDGTVKELEVALDKVMKS